MLTMKRVACATLMMVGLWSAGLAQADDMGDKTMKHDEMSDSSMKTDGMKTDGMKADVDHGMKADAMGQGMNDEPMESHDGMNSGMASDEMKKDAMGHTGSDKMK